MIRLQALQLSKDYNGQPALRPLNLTLHDGDVCCLLGQNGAGKTTTLNLFLGFIAPTAGKAQLNGVDVRLNAPDTNRFVAYIPEVVMLYGNLSGLENLRYFSRLAGFRYAPAELADCLTRAGLDAAAHPRPVRGYSKGMRQKVGIAVALAKNADVLLMDEPTSGLDPKATQEFTDLVRGLGQQGKTVLMATHDIFNAVQVGTQVGIMRQGELTTVLPTAQITAPELQELYLQTI
ncbi:ATP-binding cassette domain-containing protein [Hymenobacter lapidiphilus]|uniref:ABC transporter ATP-binding protein n=1 Tax=Hymenobacter sp. CCM 8763 TaxID=2303334 RepID=UPI000E3531C9|nr:ATP-binding cassette domain-containing protein [Hymenobacter sp. CCM 8763]RFP64319.1 ATP-binding cassette domain-containing protein [Hymenobacter sp. CCM 8763]